MSTTTELPPGAHPALFDIDIPMPIGRLRWPFSDEMKRMLSGGYRRWGAVPYALAWGYPPNVIRTQARLLGLTRRAPGAGPPGHAPPAQASMTHRPGYLTVNEVRRLLGIGTIRTERAITRGVLVPHTDRNGFRLIPEAQLVRWIEREPDVVRFLPDMRFLLRLIRQYPGG